MRANNKTRVQRARSEINEMANSLANNYFWEMWRRKKWVKRARLQSVPVLYIQISTAINPRDFRKPATRDKKRKISSRRWVWWRKRNVKTDGGMRSSLSYISVDQRNIHVHTNEVPPKSGKKSERISRLENEVSWMALSRLAVTNFFISSVRENISFQSHFCQLHGLVLCRITLTLEERESYSHRSYRSVSFVLRQYLFNSVDSFTLSETIDGEPVRRNVQEGILMPLRDWLGQVQ